MKLVGKRIKQLYYEDIEIGSEIPPLYKERFNQSNTAAFCAVFGSFSPGYFDYKFAKDYFNEPAPFAPGAEVTAWFSQLITDWAGPDAILRRLKSLLGEPLYPGVSLMMKGRVMEKYVKDGECYVECFISAENQDGKAVCSGAATLSLPSRRIMK